jgi:hypothetical protein
MDRKQAIKTFPVSVFAGLLVGTATLDFDYSLGAFVIVFLGFGGYEFITERRRGS